MACPGSRSEVSSTHISGQGSTDDCHDEGRGQRKGGWGKRREERKGIDMGDGRPERWEVSRREVEGEQI